MKDISSIDNTSVYKEILLKMLSEHRINDIPGIYAELCCYPIIFSTIGVIDGSSESYLRYEFEWYRSEDLSIKNHPGIETNPIWKNCATVNGNVNINYCCCVYSKENGDQFYHALNALLDDVHSRRAEIIYTRPSIHVEQNDGIHANQDMLCTNYIMFLIRDNTLYMHVHMRSNDIWHGLRYDLAWQQHVYSDMYSKLTDTKYEDLKKGTITWLADSLHIYTRDLPAINKFIQYNC